MSKKKILILGGYGSYGRYIARVLAANPDISCVVAGRRPPRSENLPLGVGAVALDANNSASLKGVLGGTFAVVNVTGLFADQDYNIAENCAEAGVHYVDMADRREFIQSFPRLNETAERAGVLLVGGAGASPTVSTLLVHTVAGEFDRINGIEVVRSAGNRNPGGMASLRGLLEQIGKPVRLKEGGLWRDYTSWSHSHRVRFPEPVGQRRVFVCDAPELDILPRRFGAEGASYRTGFELSVFNLGLSLVAALRRRNRLREPERLARGLMRLGSMLNRAGGDNEALGVLLHGDKAGQPLTHEAFLVTRGSGGPVIPCSPVVSLIQHWVRDGVPRAGARLGYEVLDFNGLRDELGRHDVILVRR